MKRAVLIFTLTVCCLGVVAAVISVSGSASSQPAAIKIDYPLQDSLFPPEITPPTFLWHDSTAQASLWQIDVSFKDGAPTLHLQSKGEAPKIGEIDERCVSSTNELPKLSAEQEGAHSFVPSDDQWAAIKKHSVAGPATVTITGLSGSDAVSLGQVRIQTSIDPLGAPIFYRDVPLMPSDTGKGIIKPLDPSAIPLIKWRLRDVSQPSSRVVLENVHTCANCHSFSRDGKTMGMDMDGPQNDKGLYALVSLKPETVIRNQDMVSWNPSHDLQYKLNRVAFSSQISSDGQYVVSTVSGANSAPQNNFYVVNFKDYRFLQVFYPTRGVLAWYSRATKEQHLLPGADNPRYVQTDAVWSPDDKYLVFARADAISPNPASGKMAERANDPGEVQVRYSLYRIPFNNGKGGVPVAIEGASNNGMSNNFPKISPDGRWIVFVKNRNGQLMRPDSELYIVPFQGGVARRLHANTSRMNSWHSFSPNGRWLVFSSKARSPYTQMYLTHIDQNGNDSPAILIDNSTAANRAVNLPEFVNIPPDTPLKIDTPAIEMYRRFDKAAADGEAGNTELAISEWEDLVKEEPDDARIQNNMGAALVRAGRPEDAIPHFERGLEINPQYHDIQQNLIRALLATRRVPEAIQQLKKGLVDFPDSPDLHNFLGRVLLRNGQVAEAATHFERAIELNPDLADAHLNLGSIMLSTGRPVEAAKQFSRAIQNDPGLATAHTNLGVALYYGQGKVHEALAEWRKAIELDPTAAFAFSQAAHALAASPAASDRNGDEAVKLAGQAVELSKGDEPMYLDSLAMAYAEQGNFPQAIETAQRALQMARDRNQAGLVDSLSAKIDLYQSGQPYRDDLQVRQ